MYTTFFDEIFKSWTRPVVESKGYNFKRTDYGYVLVVNTLGISEDDLEVTFKNRVLKVSGETVSEDISFENKVNYSWTTERMKDKIKDIKWETKNGLTVIHFYTEDQTEDVKVTKIK